MHENVSCDEAEKLAHLGHWEWDMLTNSQVWSDETYRIFGEIPQSFIPTFEHFMSYLSPETQLKMQESISLAIESKDIFKFNYKIEQKNGEIRYLQGLGQAKYDADGKPISMLGTVLDITKQNETEQKLKKLAMTDSLTGIFNRHKINKELDIEIERTKRYKSTFVLLMFDLDNFKAVNDTYGHDVGDYVLKEVTTIIQSHLRRSDRFGRWGGEEFIIILPELDQEQAISVAKKLKEAIAQYSFEGISQITISVGVTVFNENDTNNSILKRVDDALYEAKHAGRNIVKFL